MGWTGNSGTLRSVDERLARHLKPWSGCAKEERVDFVKALMALGYAASGIAREMETTRNAVLGFVHRNREDFPDAPARPKRQARAPAAPRPKPIRARAAAKPVPLPPPNPIQSTRPAPQPPREAVQVAVPVSDPVPLTAAIGGGGVSFDEIGDGLCRFPLWPDGAKPSVSAMRFCGAAVHCDASSWCRTHLGKVRGAS
tara:strand:- start:2017 stop:2610 length:594 start_codon:yes stop_codon:yes gene_type:complete